MTCLAESTQDMLILPPKSERKGSHWPVLEQISYKHSWNNVNYFAMMNSIMLTQFHYFYMWTIYDYYGDLLEDELITLSKEVGNKKSPKSFKYIGNIDLFKYNVSTNTRYSYDNLLKPNKINSKIFDTWETIRLISKLMFIHVPDFDNRISKASFISDANDNVIYNTIGDITRYCDYHPETFDNPNILLSMYYYTIKLYLTKSLNFDNINSINTRSSSYNLSLLKRHLGINSNGVIDINKLIFTIFHDKLDKMIIPSLQWFNMLKNTSEDNIYHNFQDNYFKLVDNPLKDKSTYNYKVIVDYKKIKDKIFELNEDKHNTYNSIIKEVLKLFIVNYDSINYSNRDKLIKPFFDKFYQKMHEHDKIA